MCNLDHTDNCQHAADAERELIVELLRELLTTNRNKLANTTGETRAVRLTGTVMGLEDAIRLIESLN
jgi:hypothetical protein